MALVVGIDEAGYGPVLGPLVVTGVVFRAPDSRARTCMWSQLRRSVTNVLSKKDPRLPVVDSKRLYNPAIGLSALERVALTTLRVAGTDPASLRDLLEAVAPGCVSHLDAYPWYRDFDVTLPASVQPAVISTAANALERDCRSQRLRLEGVCCEPLLEGHYNRLVEKTRNKAVVSLGQVLRIVQAAIDRADGESVLIYVDRQGGREHYVTSLLTSFEGYEVAIKAEDGERSVYEMRGGAAPVHVEFVTAGETKHLPIALASVYSKYLRELFMMGLNRYWRQWVQSLRPTAGYYRDGQRFIRDIAAAIEQAGVDRGMLVRVR